MIDNLINLLKKIMALQYEVTNCRVSQSDIFDGRAAETIKCDFNG